MEFYCPSDIPLNVNPGIACIFKIFWSLSEHLVSEHEWVENYVCDALQSGKKVD